MDPLSVSRGKGRLLALANAAFSSGESDEMPRTAAPASWKTCKAVDTEHSAIEGRVVLVGFTLSARAVHSLIQKQS
mgnify:CR=1 FL=1